MATLISPGTPGPALGVTLGSFNKVTNAAIQTNGSGTWDVSAVTLTTAGTCYNIDGFTLPGAGTYVVTAILINSGAPCTMFLNSASGVAANSWPVQSANGSAINGVVTMVIKVAGVTGIYLNATCATAGILAQGFIIATKIA